MLSKKLGDATKKTNSFRSRKRIFFKNFIKKSSSPDHRQMMPSMTTEKI